MKNKNKVSKISIIIYIISMLFFFFSALFELVSALVGSDNLISGIYYDIFHFKEQNLMQIFFFSLIGIISSVILAFLQRKSKKYIFVFVAILAPYLTHMPSYISFQLYRQDLDLIATIVACVLSAIAIAIPALMIYWSIRLLKK